MAHPYTPHLTHPCTRPTTPLPLVGVGTRNADPRGGVAAVPRAGRAGERRPGTARHRRRPGPGPAVAVPTTPGRGSGECLCRGQGKGLGQGEEARSPGQPGLPHVASGPCGPPGRPAGILSRHLNPMPCRPFITSGGYRCHPCSVLLPGTSTPPRGTYRQTGIQAHRQTGIQAHRQTGIQTHRQTGTQAFLDRQTVPGSSTRNRPASYPHMPHCRPCHARARACCT